MSASKLRLLEGFPRVRELRQVAVQNVIKRSLLLASDGLIRGQPIR